MSDVTANGQVVKKIAQSEVLQTLARAGIVAICTVALPIGAWIGMRLIETLDKAVEKLGGLEIKVERMSVDIDYLKRDVSELKDR